MMRLCTYISVALLSAAIAQSQETRPPVFDLHLGAGLVNGARIGARAFIDNQLSIEATYGFDIRNIVGLSDIEYRFGFGINWLVKPKSSDIISLVVVRSYQPYNKDNYSYYISPNVGFLSVGSPGLHLFARAGPVIEFHHQYNGNSTEFGFNLDFGLNIVFP